MTNPYFDIWMKAGQTAMNKSQSMALADIRSAQIEASRKVIDFWFDAWTAPLGAGTHRSKR